MRCLIIILICLSAAIPCTARIIYVDDDGPADFNNIQAAIDDANHGDTIIVADGTYTGPGNRDIDFNGKAITVRSQNGPENCIIDCQGSEADPHRGFYFNSAEDANSILVDFTICNGYADKGGGIYCNYSSPKITGCTISANTSIRWDGGGVYCRNGSSPMITNCTIAHNSAQYGGGIKFVSNSNATISNCTISGNSAEWGGGINCFTSTPTIINCAIKGNSGAGIYCSGSIKSPTIINSTVTGNGGAGIHCHGACATISSCAINANMGSGIYCTGRDNSTLVNCSVLANSGENGGGIHCGYSEIFTIRNCVVTGNSATASGGGIYCSDLANLVISNCIIWDNTASHGPQMALTGGRDNAYFSAVWTNYSDIEGGESEIYVEIGCALDWGPGNIDADPCFVDPGCWDTNGVWIEGDYHLLTSSPCVNTGDPNYIAEPNEMDLDGRPRVIGGRIDMGAYEYSPPILAEARIVPRTINLKSKGKWINCYIWLPENYNVIDIDPNSVFLEEEIQPDRFSVDEQEQIAVARFSRSDVQAILDIGEVELTISAQLMDGTVFEGTDIIRVIYEGGGKLAKFGKASNPNPADEATGLSITADLSWTAGYGATSYDVYFGTSSPPPFVCNQTAATFDPGIMVYSTKYYWRIDEVNKWGKTTGQVWSFTTKPLPPLPPTPPSPPP